MTNRAIAAWTVVLGLALVAPVPAATAADVKEKAVETKDKLKEKAVEARALGEGGVNCGAAVHVGNDAGGPTFRDRARGDALERCFEVKATQVGAAPLLFESARHRHRLECAPGIQPAPQKPLWLRLAFRERPDARLSDFAAGRVRHACTFTPSPVRDSPFGAGLNARPSLSLLSSSVRRVSGEALAGVLTPSRRSPPSGARSGG